MFLGIKNVPGHLKKWPLAADGILNIKIHVFAQQTREEGEASDHGVEVLGSRGSTNRSVILVSAQNL